VSAACSLKVDGKCPKRRGRFPRTKIRLFWDLQENPGSTLRDAADRLHISCHAAEAAHSRFVEKGGATKIPKCPCIVSFSTYCPDCLTPTVITSDVVRVCSKCGRDLPYVSQAPRAPIGGYEYTLASHWNYMRGTNPNGIKGTINELRKTPTRDGETYLMVMGDTDWKHFGKDTEDDPFVKKVLEILFDRSQTIGIPPPVYPKLDRLGVAARKVTKEHLKVVVRKKRELRALESTAMAERIVDRVLRDALPGLANL
jgi:hypothetical protein